MEAKFYTLLDDKIIVCNLCPHHCKIASGKRGICDVRYNSDGLLITENYGKVSSINIDPIEKKPLYHFFPGSVILSVGSVGCNLECEFCQNWEISQNGVYNFPYLKNYSIDEITNYALSNKNNIGVAYTYNEPTVWFEYMLDIAVKINESKLKNVIVTNGYINEEPLNILINYIDAFSIDLKAFTEEFYKKITHSELKPVKDTLKLISKNNKHIEITNLIVTGLNDDETAFEEMCKWIKNELGENTVLHLSRYFPHYKCSKPGTPLKTLTKLFDIASGHLNYVYLGNVMSDSGSNTYCDKCRKILISRQGYQTEIIGLENSGKCKFCGNKIMPDFNLS